ncbi:MAG: rhodanese-like domain-containing protein [Ignavibacterium sp.]
MKTKFLLTITIILMFDLFSFAQQKSDSSITTQQLKEKMKSDTTFIILDVRTPEELVGPLKKIDKAINIPVQELNNRINELEKYKDKEIAVICRSGHRSAIATQILKKNGYKAINVKGGMLDYNK